jgi:hypothetical protein
MILPGVRVGLLREIINSHNALHADGRAGRP